MEARLGIQPDCCWDKCLSEGQDFMPILRQDFMPILCQDFMATSSPAMFPLNLSTTSDRPDLVIMHWTKSVSLN